MGDEESGKGVGTDDYMRQLEQTGGSSGSGDYLEFDDDELFLDDDDPFSDDDEYGSDDENDRWEPYDIAFSQQWPSSLNPSSNMRQMHVGDADADFAQADELDHAAGTMDGWDGSYGVPDGAYPQNGAMSASAGQQEPPQTGIAWVAQQDFDERAVPASAVGSSSQENSVDDFALQDSARLASGGLAVDGQHTTARAGDGSNMMPLTEEEREELRRLRVEQIEWERRELEYLRKERDAARERAKQHLLAEAEQAAVRAEMEVYDAFSETHGSQAGEPTRTRRDVRTGKSDASSQVDLSEMEEDPDELRRRAVDEETSAPSRTTASLDEDRRIAEARERGRKLMEPDEDDLSMPRGQKIVLAVIVLLVLLSLLIIFVPMR